MHARKLRTTSYCICLSYAGYIGYDPPRPGQDEDVLTANNIKNGYTVLTSVPVRAQHYFSGLFAYIVIGRGFQRTRSRENSIARCQCVEGSAGPDESGAGEAE